LGNGQGFLARRKVPGEDRRTFTFVLAVARISEILRDAAVTAETQYQLVCFVSYAGEADCLPIRS
jgi:hypothetical protein